MKLVEIDCGSKVYRQGDDKTKKKIEIVDHRRRSCKDIVLARINVTETPQQSSAPVLYSRPGSAK